MSVPSLTERYERLKKLAKNDLKSDAVTAELSAIFAQSLAWVMDVAARQDLASNVPGKAYFMYKLKTGAKTSRPVNASLFDPNVSPAEFGKIAGGDVNGIAAMRLDQLLYTSAMAFCIATDLTGAGNQKTPGTFFEFFAGHLAAIKFNMNPAKRVKVPNADADVDNSLPTDFIFDLGSGKSRIHMPVKTSTRERVVQAWAHQRVLEGMLGAGRYRGILVALTETNKQKEVSVAEVCLPGQWAAYQMYLAPLYRVYYLDLPKAYEPLRDKYPFIQIWPFSRFFTEYEKIANPAP
jgi:hypothetical protein